MPKIEIISPEDNGEGVRGAVVPWGTIVKVDGRELDEVRSIRVDLNMDSVVTARLEVNVTEKFQFEGIVDLHVNACVLPGYRLIEETRADGSKSYRAEAEA